MKIEQELKREFAITEKEFIEKLDNIFIKLFKNGITKIILDSIYIINKEKENELQISELMLDRINNSILVYDTKNKKYTNIKSMKLETKYNLLDKILF